jgi:Tfp pilus assembly protein PilP
VKEISMKLIQSLAFALGMAAMAVAQTSSPTPQAGAAQHTAAKPTAKSPMVKPAATKSAPAPAMKSANATKSATVPAKAHSNVATVPKPATAHAASKPAVATGSLPAKKSSGAKKPAAPVTVAHSAAKPTVSPVPANKGNAKAIAKLTKVTTPLKGKIAAKPMVSPVPQKSSMAQVERPKTEQKAPVPAKLLGAAGRRDPFVSPIRNASAVTAQSCAGAKRCLAIPELVLQGTVRDVTGKMMAVVSTSNRRTYTLRENDQVYNGSVEKITSDSIIFREFVKDAVGRETAKEIVKKIGPTS